MLEEFIKRLMRFDWFYQYSDDYSIWKCAQREHDQIRAVADTGRPFKMAYDAVAKYMCQDYRVRGFAQLDNQLNEARALEKTE